MALTQSKKKKIEELLGDLSAEDIADFFAEQSETSMAEVVEKRLADQQEDLGSDDVEREPSADNEPGDEIKPDVAEETQSPRSDSERMEDPASEVDEKEAMRLFEMIMGASFNPESSEDVGKMEVLKKAKSENPDLSDSQLALKIYKDYM
tara:strand:- start:5969 stop:6418 length:450 start_codon:yes stop_codon:yes gene_type:complete